MVLDGAFDFYLITTRFDINKKLFNPPPPLKTSEHASVFRFRLVYRSQTILNPKKRRV